MAALAASTSASDEQTSAQGNECLLDTNLLKEIGKKALVDALNSVCCHVVLRSTQFQQMLST